MDKVSVYCLDPLNFRCISLVIVQCSITRSSKNGSSQAHYLNELENTILISLDNNLGTLLTLVLGCFPLDIQPLRTMSDDSILIEALSSPNTH